MRLIPEVKTEVEIILCYDNAHDRDYCKRTAVIIKRSARFNSGGFWPYVSRAGTQLATECLVSQKQYPASSLTTEVSQLLAGTGPGEYDFSSVACCMTIGLRLVAADIIQQALGNTADRRL